MKYAPKTYKKVEYRNGTYIGQLKSTGNSINNPNYNISNFNDHIGKHEYIREGFGMFLCDDSDLIIGRWSNNQLTGDYVYLSRFLRAFGTMNDGQLNGFNMIAFIGGSQKDREKFMRVMKDCFHHNKFVQAIKKDMTVYGNFRYGQPYGHILVVMQNFIIVSKINEEGQQQIIQQCLLNAENLQASLRQYFPYVQITELPLFLTNLVGSAVSQSKQEVKSQYKPCRHAYENDCKFFGFIHSYTECQYGVLIRQHEIISMGIHHQGILNGIGTMFTRLREPKQMSNSEQNQNWPTSTHKKPSIKYKGKGCIMNGVFNNGELEGVGVCYSPENNHYIFGNFINKREVEAISTGVGWPISIIKGYQMQFHLRSPKFYSEFCDINRFTQELITILYIVSGKKFEQPNRRFTTQNTAQNTLTNNPKTRFRNSSSDKKHDSRQKQKHSEKNSYHSGAKSIGGSKYFFVGKNDQKTQELKEPTILINGVKEQPSQQMRRRNWTNTSAVNKKPEPKSDFNRYFPQNQSNFKKQKNKQTMQETISKSNEQNFDAMYRNSLYFNQRSIKRDTSSSTGRKDRATTMYTRQH